MDTACPRSCCSRAYASNRDCDCAVPADDVLYQGEQKVQQPGAIMAGVQEGKQDVNERQRG